MLRYNARCPACAIQPALYPASDVGGYALETKYGASSRCSQQESVETVADVTVKCLLRSVPAAVPGIMFLSGGQASELASARLNSMNVRFKSKLPWALSFSYSRAILQPALEIWQGKETNIVAAQKALYHRVRCNGAAARGDYNADLENFS